MSDKLKQIESLLDEEIRSMNFSEILLREAYLTETERGREHALLNNRSVYIEALTLLKEVEEGKAWVMRWVEGSFSEKNSYFLSSQKHNGDGQRVPIVIENHFGKLYNPSADCEHDIFFSDMTATFNNNNGEIPQPKED